MTTSTEIDPAMRTVTLKDAKTNSSALVEAAVGGEFVTVTRHGKPVAALVSLEAAEIARRALADRSPGLASYPKKFPGGESERSAAPSRRADL